MTLAQDRTANGARSRSTRSWPPVRRVRRLSEPGSGDQAARRTGSSATSPAATSTPRRAALGAAAVSDFDARASSAGCRRRLPAGRDAALAGRARVAGAGPPRLPHAQGRHLFRRAAAVACGVAAWPTANRRLRPRVGAAVADAARLARRVGILALIALALRRARPSTRSPTGGVVIRIGVALPMTLNIPFRMIDGGRAATLMPTAPATSRWRSPTRNRIAYLHALAACAAMAAARPEPMLRAVRMRRGSPASWPGPGSRTRAQRRRARRLQPTPASRYQPRSTVTAAAA